jgi:predicted phosphodiesterase
VRRALLIGIVVLLSLAGAMTGLRLAGPATYNTKLGVIQVKAGLSVPSRRGLEVYVPLADWGLRAQVTGAPIRFSAEPRGINRAGVARTINATDPEAVIKPLRREIDHAFTSAALRAGGFLLAGALAGGLIALLLWHLLGVRGRRLALAPAGAVGLAALLTGGLIAWASISWKPERLERPRYYASGAELQRIIDQAERLRATGERYSDQVDQSIRSIAGLLSDRTAPDPTGTRRILLASDIHNNLLPLPTLKRFGADHPVFLDGDYTINGSRPEARLLPELTKIGTETVAVSGNHDSPGVMKTLAANGALVLTHIGSMDARGVEHGPPVRIVAGLKVAGFEDPLAYDAGDYPDGIRFAISYSELADGHERFLRDVETRWQWWKSLPERPDVLMIHQQAIGRALAQRIWQADPDGPPLTIMVGHTHVQYYERAGPVTIVNSGTAGAGGIFGVGSQAVGMALMDFTSAGVLEATDLIQTDPTTTAAQARRIITADPDCDGDTVVCDEAPDVSER